MKAVINASRNVDRDIALAPFSSRAPALRARLSYDSTHAMTPTAGGDAGEAAKYALLYPMYLPGAVTGVASDRVGARLGADAVAHSAVFNARHFYLLFTAEDSFLKVNGEVTAQVSAMLWRLTRSCGGTAKEGIKDIAEATEIGAGEASAPDALSAIMTVAVIGGTLLSIGKHLVSLVYRLELFFSALFGVMVGMILEGKLTKSLLYLFLAGVSIHAENFIIVTLGRHRIYIFKEKATPLRAFHYLYYRRVSRFNKGGLMPPLVIQHLLK